MLKIVNIVATVKMEKKFNLNLLLEKLPNAKQSKHWVNIRLPKFNNYIAFYKNAKFLITGAHSEKELNIIAKHVVSYLKEYDINNNIKEITINNCVAIAQLDFNVTLEDLIVKLWQYDVSYEPEQFPALKFKDKKGHTFLLFNSGKITVTGIKSLDNLEDYVNEFKNLIYKKSKS